MRWSYETIYNYYYLIAIAFWMILRNKLIASDLSTLKHYHKMLLSFLVFVVSVLLGETCEYDHQCSGTKNATLCLHVQNRKECSCQKNFVAINDKCYKGLYFK